MLLLKGEKALFREGLPSPGPGWLSSSEHLLTVSEDDAAVGKSTWEPLPNQDFRSSFLNREKEPGDVCH